MSQSRILIVEDEPFVVRDIRQQLEDLGYESVGDTARAEDAIAMAEQLKPDLVLMDIHLEGEMDGIAAAQIIHDRFDLPVVFLTAFAGEETVDRAKKSDPFGYIIKPFDEREMRTVIEMALYKHQAENQLRKNREEQAAILRTAQDGFWLVDLDGRILDVNEANCRMHGYTREEMLGKALADFEVDETAEEIAAGIQELKRLGSARLEGRHRCKDGHLIDVEVSLTYLHGGSGRFSAFLRDITGRKQMEAALRTSEERAAKVFRTIPDGIVISRLSDGLVFEVNDSFCRVSGLAREEIIGRSMAEVDLWDDLSTREQFIQTLRTKGRVEGMEAGFHNPAGDRRTIALSAELIEHDQDQLVLTITHDITERKQAEEVLRENEDRYRDLVDSSQEVIATYDLEGNFLSVNETSLRITGYPRESVLKMNLADLIVPEMRPLFPEYLKTVREAGRARGVMQIQTAAGETRFWEYDSTLRTEGVAQPIVRGMALDITERRNAEKALRASEAHLQVIIESTDDGILAIGAQGKIIKANSRFMELWGVPASIAAEGDHQALLDHVLPMVADPDAFLRRVVELNGSNLRALDLVQLKDGRSFERLSTPMLDGAAVTGRVSSFRDVSERRRAETALRENEDRYRDLVENSRELISTFDLDGNFLSVNEATVRLTGYSRQALLKMNLTALVAPGLQPQLRESLKAMKASGGADGIMRIQTASGETRFWEYHGSVRTEGLAKPVIRGMGLDITERRQAEKALRTSESQLRVILESTGDGILAVNQHGKILQTNSRFAELWRVPPSLLARGDDQALLDHVLDQLSDPAAFLGRVQALYGSDAPDMDEIHFKDGRCFERFSSAMLEGKAITGRVWSFRDISGRKRAEEALRASEERFKTMFLQAPLGIAFIDSLTGRFLQVNSRYAAIAGRSMEEMADLSWMQITHPDDVPPDMDKMASLIEGKIDKYRMEKRYLHPDGAIVWIAMTVAPLMDEDVEHPRHIAMIQDITERKWAEQALLESERSLMESQRISGLGSYVMDVATGKWKSSEVLDGIFGIDAAYDRTTGNWAALIHPGDREGLMAYLANDVLPTRGRFDKEYRIIRYSDHSMRWVHGLGKFELSAEDQQWQMLGTIQDITERKEAEQSLNESHERFELANRATFNVIWDWDLRTNAFWRNDNFQKMFGFAREEVETDFASSTSRIHPEDLERVQAGINASLANPDNEFWADQYRFRRKDGSYAFVEDRAVIARDAEGHAVRMLGAMQDISERKQAEQALRESEEKLRVIIEHSVQLFYSHSPDNVLTYVSPQVEAFLETGPEDTYKPWTDYLTDNPINALGVELTRKAIETGERQAPYELELVSARGRKLWVEVHESPVVEDGKVAAMVGALTDITDSKLAHDQLLLQSSALEAAANAITITDQRGLIQWVNPAFTALTGYSEAEAIGQRPGDLVKSGKHDQAFYVAMWTALLSGEVWRGEITNRRKDGSLYTGEKIITPLKDDRGRITHFTSVEQDITERKRAEASLRLQGSALEAAANAIVITDREGVIEWANAAFEAFTGYGVSEAVGKRPGDLLKSGQHDQAFYKAMWDELIAGAIWQGEIINKRKDGSLYTEEMTITPLRDVDGAISHFIAVKQDITERKRAEAELTHLNRSLKMLSACDEALVRGDDEGKLLQVICQIAIEIGGYRMAWVGYAQEDAERSIRPIAFAGEEQGYLSEIKVTWSEHAPAGMGPAGRAIRSGQPSVFEDVAQEPAAFHWLEAMQRRGYRGTISLPLRSGGRAFGVLTLYSAEPFHLPQQDLDLLQEMADDLAFGIGNIRAQLERKQMQQAVLKMAQGVSGGTSATSGEAFFDLMVASLTEALRADGGFIGRLAGSGFDALQTVSFMAEGRKQENFAYALGGTPCELVVEGETCLFESGIQRLFPGDQIARDFGVEAYAGEPLFDSKGQVLGLLAVYFGKPMENSELVKSTLRIFASRAAGELERQEADARIREQASLLDKAHDAIMVRDMDHRILFWNQGAERIYGWTAAEAVGQSAFGLFYDSLDAVEEAQRAVLADGEWEGKLLHRRKDGNLVSIEGHWTLVRDEYGQPRSVLAINTDITERLLAEQDLHQYTERLEAMRDIDVALLGARSTGELSQGALTRLRHIVPFERAAVVLFDSGLTEGAILAVDQDTPWLPLPGEARPIADFHALEDLQAAPFLDLPDLSEVHGCAMEELLLSQGLRNLVYLPMEGEGALMGFVALSATTPGLLTPQHAEIALDMTDQLTVALQHTRMREELELSNQLLESKVEKRTAELRSTVATLQVLEGELRQREAEARAASEAKSTFLSSMSHELRTPLIGITGMLELLRETTLGDDQRQALDVIHESSESLLRIIGDILDFSKIEANKLELSPHAFSVRSLLESISQTFKSPISARGLAFHVEVDPRLAPAHVADALRIRQILNNFLSNAVKFTEKGAITLKALLLASRDGHESLAFEVQDTGIGVSRENMAKLFDPFTQAEASTTRRFGGTGLGLAISRSLAEIMGGSLEMQSTLGQGTTICLKVELPVGDAREITVHSAKESPRTAPTRSAPSLEAAEREHSLVLMAEDHPTNRIVLTQQVNRAGFALEVAVDGQEAFEKWQSGRYALILTDLHMPRLDGYQLTAAVRSWEHAHQTGRTPILALTANAMSGEAERCLELGMDDYLIKPVTIALLSSKLRQWMPHVRFGSALEPPPVPTAAPLEDFGWPGVDSRTLLDLCGGNAESAQEVMNDFIATTIADLQLLEDGLRQMDKPCIVRQAHRIKGSAAMIGARDLAAKATELEVYAFADIADWATIQAQLAGLRKDLEALRTAVE